MKWLCGMKHFVTVTTQKPAPRNTVKASYYTIQATVIPWDKSIGWGGAKLNEYGGAKQVTRNLYIKN